MTAMRRLRHAIRQAAPVSYNRARNAVMVSSWYWSRMSRRQTSEVADPYDEEFWVANEAGDWEGFARAIVRACHPRSVLDVGCGSGALLRALSRVAPGVRTLGLEHSPEARRRAERSGVKVEPWDATHLGWPREPPPAHFRDWDLVVCLEVAEHLPPWHGRRLVRFLSDCDAVLFSAAQPGQGGVWHVNEQPLAYWLRRFARHGLHVHPAGEGLRRELEGLQLAPWYAANIVLLARAPATSGPAR
jgi:SAM-dependent methyltransferase